jgi:hypothetical protein
MVKSSSIRNVRDGLNIPKRFEPYWKAPKAGNGEDPSLIPLGVQYH